MRVPMPEHEAPKHPLSEISRRKLAVVAAGWKRLKLAEKHHASVKQLGNSAHALAEALRELEKRTERQRKKEAGDVAEWEEKLEAWRGKQQGIGKRLEKYARTGVDLAKRDSVMEAMLDDMSKEPGVAATQRTRRGNTQGGMSSFEPTLPGATEQDEDEEGDTTTNNAPAESTLEKFKARRVEAMESWTSKSLFDRYAGDKHYAEFKSLEYEGLHGDEDDNAPPSTKWFESEEPAPGTATQGAADESDDDIMVARTKISTKCPLTLQEFKEPVVSTECSTLR